MSYIHGLDFKYSSDPMDLRDCIMVGCPHRAVVRFRSLEDQVWVGYCGICAWDRRLAGEWASKVSSALYKAHRLYKYKS